MKILVIILLVFFDTAAFAQLKDKSPVDERTELGISIGGIPDIAYGINYRNKYLGVNVLNKHTTNVINENKLGVLLTGYLFFSPNFAFSISAGPAAIINRDSNPVLGNFELSGGAGVLFELNNSMSFMLDYKSPFGILAHFNFKID